ncbi:hypothetical protein [Sphingopyxis sp.]|uniref:hypothetical protein n=1 Tax=Sphingopyxis sp. TaxID=1908224 RepID=UPI00311EEF27
MTRTTNLAALAGLSLMLGGCAATAVPRVTPPPTSSAPAPLNPPRVTQNNALVGRDANSALRLFGKPRLDVSEGAGRKLQFASSACVLDVYYYAQRSGAEALATHVDARTPDGRDANIDSCIAALRR